MPRLKAATLEFDVYAQCDVCGRSLEISQTGNDLVVTPCEKCLEDEYSKGEQAGKEAGQ